MTYVVDRSYIGAILYITVRAKRGTDMHTIDATETLVERFFDIMGQETLSEQDEIAVSTIIRLLGWTESDLRDIAARCARRAIYLQNTQ